MAKMARTGIFIGLGAVGAVVALGLIWAYLGPQAEPDIRCILGLTDFDGNLLYFEESTGDVVREDGSEYCTEFNQRDINDRSWLPEGIELRLMDGTVLRR